MPSSNTSNKWISPLLLKESLGSILGVSTADMQNSILCFSSFGQPSSTACQCFPHFHAPYPQSHVCLCRFVSIIQSDLVSSWILRRMEGNEANPDVIILFCFCVCSLDDTAQVLRIHGGYNSSLHSEKMCELKDGCATVSKKKNTSSIFDH